MRLRERFFFSLLTGCLSFFTISSLAQSNQTPEVSFDEIDLLYPDTDGIPGEEGWITIFAHTEFYETNLNDAPIILYTRAIDNDGYIKTVEFWIDSMDSPSYREYFFGEGTVDRGFKIRFDDGTSQIYLKATDDDDSSSIAILTITVESPDEENEIPDIPQESLSGIIKTDGTATVATITIGASSNGGENSDVIFLANEPFDVTAKIYPEVEELNSEGEIYVVVRTMLDGEKVFVALNEESLWVLWNTSLKSLPTAKHVESLSDVEEILIHTGKMVVGERLIYVGYSISTIDGEKPVITTNGIPFKIKVLE